MARPFVRQKPARRLRARPGRGAAVHGQHQLVRHGVARRRRPRRRGGAVALEVPWPLPWRRHAPRAAAVGGGGGGRCGRRRRHGARGRRQERALLGRRLGGRARQPRAVGGVGPPCRRLVAAARAVGARRRGAKQRRRQRRRRRCRRRRPAAELKPRRRRRGLERRQPRAGVGDEAGGKGGRRHIGAGVCGRRPDVLRGGRHRQVGGARAALHRVVPPCGRRGPRASAAQPIRHLRRRFATNNIVRRVAAAARAARRLFDMRQGFSSWLRLVSPAASLRMVAPGLLLSAHDDGSVRLVGGGVRRPRLAPARARKHGVPERTQRRPAHARRSTPAASAPRGRSRRGRGARS